jgi:glycoside/pentoside/hexuronide:cation symporter, GPH family
MTASEKIRLREKLSYGAGDFASCLYWASFSTFLLKFYTDVFGISGAAAGLIFLWSRVWDGVNDPIVGALADRTKSRWGRFRPWILFGCVPFAVSGVLAFTTPDLGMIGKVIWAAVTYNMVMMMYTVVNIPYSALLGVLTPDSLSRTAISSIRFFFAFSAGMFVKTTLPTLTTTLGGGNLRLGYQLTFGLYGAIATAMFLTAFFGTKERVEPAVAQKTDLRGDLAALMKNGPWWVLLATILPFILFVAIRGTILAHYVDYFVGEQTLTLPLFGTRTYGYTQLFSAFGFVGDVGSLLGVLMVTWFARQVGKKAAFMLLLSVAIVATASVYFLRPEHVVILFGLHFVGSMTSGPLFVLLWAMYADIADYGEWKTGRRTTGLVFSASSLSGKMSWAVGGYYAARMLTETGYVPNAVQNAEVLAGMRSMMSMAPALVGLVALGIFAFYPLSEQKVSIIAAEMTERTRDRSAAGTAD